MKKVGIIGATGYAGVELVRLLLSHPNVKIEAISSVSFEGKPISEIYPSLYNICDMTLENQEDVIAKCDVVFASLPHGLSEEMGLDLRMGKTACQALAGEPACRDRV